MEIKSYSDLVNHPDVVSFMKDGSNSVFDCYHYETLSSVAAYISYIKQ